MNYSYVSALCAVRGASICKTANKCGGVTPVELLSNIIICVGESIPAINLTSHCSLTCVGVAVPSTVERKELQQFPVVKEVASEINSTILLCVPFSMQFLYFFAESVIPPVSTARSCSAAEPRTGGG